jgi:hypothetical protein
MSNPPENGENPFPGGFLLPKMGMGISKYKKVPSL